MFPAVRLEGAVDPPRVLKPEDLIERSSNYTPRMGFRGDRSDRASLGRAGHRMVGFHSGRGGNRGGAAIGPPPSLMRGTQMVWPSGDQSERPIGIFLIRKEGSYVHFV